MSERKVRKKNTTPAIQSIYDIHQTILQQFESDYHSLPKLKSEYNTTKDPEEKRTLQNKILLIESGMREAQYLFKAQSILEDYDLLLSKPVKVSFMGKTKEQIENERLKEEIINKYLSIAKLFTNITLLPTIGYTCEHCSAVLIKTDEEYLCDKCGCSTSPLITLMHYQDSERINSSSRYSYARKDNFGISIKKFQGIQNITIPLDVYKLIQEKMDTYDISIDHFTMDQLYEFLQITGYSSYAEDAILIYKTITGKPGPDISSLEEKLFEMFDLVDPVYERIKLPSRINALNSQYLLFKFLQRLKYKCNDSDFYILKTREKLIEHDEMWKLICEQLEWTFEPTV